MDKQSKLCPMSVHKIAKLCQNIKSELLTRGRKRRSGEGEQEICGCFWPMVGWTEAELKIHALSKLCPTVVKIQSLSSPCPTMSSICQIYVKIQSNSRIMDMKINDLSRHCSINYNMNKLRSWTGIGYQFTFKP